MYYYDEGVLYMTDNEYWYKYYLQKYNDSCYEIYDCDYRIYNLKNQRQQKVNLINKLKTEMQNTQTAFDGVGSILKSEEKLNNCLVDVANKTSQASVNFTNMVNSSDVKSKSLTDVYSDETTKTKNVLNNVLSKLKLRKNNLRAKLSNLQTELNHANGDLQSIDSDIRRISSDMSYWKQQKTNNYYNMEYYRRKMMQEVC